ncbi:right-handed parallel beta-helix repeat-containing protein [Chitinophaga caseinilytica]|uniref:right-handed parallel beta-helix repeat-containing protein n=1 Tax=Chitinophaga caseinilytica TaxID=2267521 RepID=UPI003C2E994F
MKRMIIQGFALLALLAATACSKGGNGGESPKPQNGPRTLYVSTSGNDNAPGTKDAPYAKINDALAKAVAGDTVMVRGGKYFEKVRFPRSGREGKLITLKAYPGEQPVLDGTGLGVSGKDAMVFIRNASYVVLEGFEICNLISSAPWVNPNGVLADEGSGNIIIRRNKIHHIEHNAAPTDGRSGHAIEIIGNTAVAMKNVLVEDNEIHDCNTGYSENLTINGFVDGFVIRRNKIYNAENIGIDAAGGYAGNPVPERNYARNGVISENELWNIDMSTGPIGGTHGHGAIGIYVDGARNIIVERNRVRDCDRGIGVVSETDAFPTSDCIVRNNIVTGSHRVGIYMGGYLNYTGGGSRRCYVLNNTLVGNNRERGAYGEIEGELRMTEHCFDNVFRNNLVVAGADDLFFHKYTNTGSGNVVDNNLYFAPTAPAGWIWNSINGPAITDFATWKTTSGVDAASIHGKDPLLPGDFRIPANSPAKNAGFVVADDKAGTVDFYGQPRVVNGKTSIGAVQ